VIDHARCEGKRDCVDVCPYDVFEVRRIDDADFQALSWLARAKVFVHRRTRPAPRPVRRAASASSRARRTRSV
jgi:NAD-dependent dihydropyrimidine dehydrogenase PreA subunit